jgi:hypothetical protein
MNRQDALRILGFAKNQTPTSDEIAKKYRRQALVRHPDKKDSISEKKIAEDDFKELGAAYEFLKTNADSNTINSESSFFDDFDIEAIFGDSVRLATELVSDLKNYFTSQYKSENELKELIQAYNAAQFGYGTHYQTLNVHISEFRKILEENEQLILKPDTLFEMFKAIKGPFDLMSYAAHHPNYYRSWAPVFNTLERAAEQGHAVALSTIAEYILVGHFYPINKNTVSWAKSTLQRLDLLPDKDIELETKLKNVKKSLKFDDPIDELLKTALHDRQLVNSHYTGTCIERESFQPLMNFNPIHVMQNEFKNVLNVIRTHDNEQSLGDGNLESNENP